MFFIFDNSSPAPATLSNLKYWRTSTKYLLLGLMCSKRGSVSGRSLWVYPGVFEVCRGSHPLSSLWQALPWTVYRCAGCLSRYHSSCGCNLEIHCRRPVLNFWWLHLFSLTRIGSRLNCSNRTVWASCTFLSVLVLFFEQSYQSLTVLFGFFIVFSLTACCSFCTMASSFWSKSLALPDCARLTPMPHSNNMQNKISLSFINV